MSSGAVEGLTSEELRAAVREVLRDVLPSVITEERQPAQAAHVSLRSDAELQAFVRRLAELCEDPVTRAQLRDGRRSFRLAGLAGGGSTATGTADGGALRVDRGAVTERMVARAAGQGGRLVLGARAVLTPLARDKARALGVRIEKER